MTDEKGVIWGAEGADYCGNSVSFLPTCLECYNTDLGRDLPFGDDAGFRRFA
jgi:hypothetical protein